jgi:hypothetical protein
MADGDFGRMFTPAQARDMEAELARLKAGEAAGPARYVGSQSHGRGRVVVEPAHGTADGPAWGDCPACAGKGWTNDDDGMKPWPGGTPDA